MRYLTGLVVIVMAATAVAQDMTPDKALRKNRTTYHPVMDVLGAKRTAVTDQQLEELRKFPLEAIWGVLKGLGYNNYYIGMKATLPDVRLVGRALTIRYLPRRPDLEEAMGVLAKEGDWPVSYNVRAAEEARPGDIPVVDLGGEITGGVFFGDISALGAQTAGARGAVLYGSTRDLAELREMKAFPVFAVGFDPNVATQIGVDWNVPIRVGGATVLPGDVVVAEDEAILFFPPQLTTDVIKQAKQLIEQEIYERNLVRGKKYRFRDVYPLNPELHKKFEAEQKVKEQEPKR
jgi:4-hydroxy-4-methyl-2-oxoglutarate aldolase